MSNVRVIPKEKDPATGKLLSVPDPALRDFLPEEGRVVPDSAYWRRRAITGEVDLEEVADEVPAGG